MKNTTITTDRLAPAPSRATTSLTLTAGALVIPLSVYTATEDISIKRHERLDGDPAIEVGRAYIRKDTGAQVESDHVTRMAEATDGRWVTVTEQDLATVYGDTGEASIMSFVPATDAARYTFDGVLQVRSKRDKRASAQAANDSAFTLLLAGLRDRGVSALVRFITRGGPRFGLLTADGDLLTIIPANAVRAALPIPAVQHDQAAVAMMGKLIDAIGVMSVAVEDDTPIQVQSFVDRRAAEVGVAVGDVVPAISASAPRPVVDVMGLLEQSIKAAKEAKAAPAKPARKPRAKAVAK